jgi:hypothetical protein
MHVTAAMSLAAAVVVLPGCGPSNHGAAADADPPTDVWQLIARATADMPLTREKVEAVLGVEMTTYRDRAFADGDDPPRHWKATNIGLSSTLAVKYASFEVQGDGSWRIASFDFASPTACVTVDDVRREFPEMALTSRPSGHSPEEEFVWGVEQDWGALSFGFPESGGDPKPGDCLKGISLQPSPS